MIGLLALLKVTALLTLAALLVRCMRRASAASRHVLSITALSLSLWLPCWPALAPAHMPALPAWTILANSAASVERAHPAPVHWLMIVWFAGVLAVGIRFAAGVVYLWHRAGLASERAALPEHLNSLLPARGVAAKLAPIASPVVWGWLRPGILLPESSQAWSEERQRLALQHELAYVGRGDLWTGLILRAAQAVYWFHPLVWWITAKAVEEQELACDESVLAGGASAPEYASLLVETARQISSLVPFGCPIVSHSQSLRGRIMHILQFRSHSAPARWNRGAAFSFVALVFGAGLLLCAPDQPTQNPDTVQSRR